MSDLNITDQSFEGEVLKNELPVLVDFWAPWCAPCRIVSPIVEELAKEYEGKLKVGKLNVDDNPDTSARYGVMSIPSLIFFKDGKPVKTMVGAQGKENFKRGIEEVLGG
ncbi:MAG: thioredoxin [Patescibacteria group bacterium]|nr:thioredoxin [Patescibacteria group bacterium]MCL6096718.1 thioredoxin [Patescibacteria group bacterium]